MSGKWNEVIPAIPTKNYIFDVFDNVINEYFLFTRWTAHDSPGQISLGLVRCKIATTLVWLRTKLVWILEVHVDAIVDVFCLNYRLFLDDVLWSWANQSACKQLELIPQCIPFQKLLRLNGFWFNWGAVMLGTAIFAIFYIKSLSLLLSAALNVHLWYALLEIIDRCISVKLYVCATLVESRPRTHFVF